MHLRVANSPAPVLDPPFTTNTLPRPAPLKRPLQPLPDAQHYDNTRKILHLDSDNSPDPHITPLRQPIQLEQADLQTTKEGTPEKEEGMDPLLTPPLREKYAHLIPDFQSANYSLDHKILLRLQVKLDEHLQYLKQHRGRKRGDFFKSIRCHIIADLHQIKQILFIDPSLYLCSNEEDKEHNFDVLIDLPPLPDLLARRTLFKQQLYLYLNQQGAFEPNRKGTVAVPLFKFPFEEKIEQENKATLQRQLQSASNQEEAKEAKEEKKLTLKQMFSKDFKFKEVLYQKILEKENKIKEQARVSVQPKQAFDRLDVLKVLDELHLAYAAKKISNMFRATLMDKITKQLNMQDNIAADILELICERTGGYLKKVNHSKGLILQVDRLLYSATREGLLGLQL